MSSLFNMKNKFEIFGAVLFVTIFVGAIHNMYINNEWKQINCSYAKNVFDSAIEAKEEMDLRYLGRIKEGFYKLVSIKEEE